MDFKVRTVAADDIDADDDENGIVNGSHSFIDKLSILANGREVYNCTYANHCVNIKNLLEYNPSYKESMSFTFLTHQEMLKKNKFTKRQLTHRRNAANNVDEAGEMIDDIEANYNKGFAARKTVL